MQYGPAVALFSAALDVAVPPVIYDSRMAPDTIRWVLACAYAAAVALLALSWARSPVAIPLMLMALGWPLVFRLVPRNYVYGYRTTRTLFTNSDAWYRENVIAGLVMVAIGVVWLLVVAFRSLLSA
jgi:hypothetical protein